MLHHHKKSFSDKRKPAFIESERLRQEIEDLEDALILHTRFQAESDNSVKEMIRKELGTHWEHGGEGKLTMYKSGKDLGNQGMREHPFVQRRAKDMKQQLTASCDKGDDKLRRDKESFDAVVCASAGKKARKLKKVKSTEDKQELKDKTSDVDKLAVLKITSIKVTTSRRDSPEIIVETADVKQDAILKTSSLKDELSVIRKQKSCSKKANYNSKLHLDSVDKKHSKNMSHNSLPESLLVLEASKLTNKDNPRTGVKISQTKSVSQLCVHDNVDNFTSGIQHSFNSRNTSNVTNNIKLNYSHGLDGIANSDKSLMFETVNYTNQSDNSTYLNEYEWPRSKTLVENMDLNKNSYDDARFFSKQDQIVDNKEKWAVKHKDVLLEDLDYIQVPCGSSCTKDGCGDIFTDFDVLEDQQEPLFDRSKHACLSDAESFKNYEQQNEANKKMLSCQESPNTFSSTRQEFSAVHSSVPSLKHTATNSVNSDSDMNSLLIKCSSYEPVDEASFHSVSCTDMNVAGRSVLCDMLSSFPETYSPNGKSMHEVDMESWLHSLGLDSVEHYIQLFHKHHLDMSKVQLLSATDLRQMGIHAIGPIMKIMKGVLVLGRDKDLVVLSPDHTNSGDKQGLCVDTDARHIDSNIEMFDLSEMSTKFSDGLKFDTDKNVICKLEQSDGKTSTKFQSSPVFRAQKTINKLDGDKPAHLDFGTTENVNSSDGESEAMGGVSRVLREMLRESSKHKEVVDKHQMTLQRRRTKQPVLGVRRKPPVNNNVSEKAVAAQKLHMKQKYLRSKEADGIRSIMRHKQLQDLESNKTSVGQRNDKEGQEVSKLQSHLVVHEENSEEYTFRKLSKSSLEHDTVEPLRCLHSVELNKLHKSEHESICPSSAKKGNAHERKQQEVNKKQSFVNEEEKSDSEKAYTDDGSQTKKVSSSKSHNKDCSRSSKFNRYEELVNGLFTQRNAENYISDMVKREAINETEIQKEIRVAQPATVIEAERCLLKSKKLQHKSLRNKDSSLLREGKKSTKYKEAGLCPNYISDAIEKVELSRTDVVFSEKDLIGSGNFSQVFKGTYQGSEVAVKRLKTPLKKKDLSCFISEISALQDLRHPHVAMLLGICSRQEKFPLIVTEFLACGSLHRRLYGPGRTDLERDEFYQIAEDVSAGMMYLHNHRPSILHLDLKPKNILIGHGARAKVADFGSTKLRFKEEVKLQQTRESPSWMAPELFTCGEITPKADVYSFGMVLWEMLTRQHPYDNLSVFQVLECVQANRRPPLPSECPKGLSQLIQKCWHQNPAARPRLQEVSKCLEQLSQTCEWITSPEAVVELESKIMDVNSTPEYSRDIECSLKEGQLKTTEKTPEIDLFDLISLSSQDFEESSSCNGNEGESLSALQRNDPEKSTSCNVISSTDSTCGVEAFTDRKSNPYSADIKQPTFYLPFSCSSVRSCLSLLDNENNNGRMRPKTADQLNEFYSTSEKPRISVSKSQDSLQSSASFKKLLPLRNSLQRSKIISSSLEGKGFKPKSFINTQTKRKINHHFLSEEVLGRMCENNKTISDSVKNPAVTGSNGLIKGQGTLNSSSVKEEVFLAPCSEAVLYVPSFHDKVTPIRLTTEQQPAGLNSDCCPESPIKDQSSNYLKESLSYSHVEVQPLYTSVNSQSETHKNTNIKTHDKTLQADGIDLGNTTCCRMDEVNKDSQNSSSLGQSTKSSVILNTPKSKQVEADRCHLLKNMLDEKEDTNDRKTAGICFLAENLKISSAGSDNFHISSARSDNVQTPSEGSDNVQISSARSDNVQIPPARSDNVQISSARSDNVQIHSEGSDNVQISSARSDNVQIPSARSGNVQISSARSDNVQIHSEGSDNVQISSARSDNVQIPPARSDNVQIPPARSDNVQIPSARSSNVQISSARSDKIPTPARPDEIGGFNEETDYSTESNYSTSLRGHEPTGYQSDSDSSTISDISQDSLNKYVAACPSAVTVSDHRDLTRCTPSTLVMNSNTICKSNANELPAADDLNTENPSANNICLTNHQGINAGHRFVGSEQKIRAELTDLFQASSVAGDTKYSKIPNKAEDHFSECLWPEVQKRNQLKSRELARSQGKMLEKETVLREKRKRNTTESMKVPQLEEAEQHKLMTLSLSQKQHLLKKLPSCPKICVSDSKCVLHNEDKTKDLLPSHSNKQTLKHLESTSCFSISANILVAQKKLLKPVVAKSSFSDHTHNESEKRSPTVITILKKAMTDRRFAMGDTLESQELTPETSWSLEG